MSIEDKISIVNTNAVEVHYWFNDNTHLMDAYIQNKCEYELLGILKEISNAFRIEIVVETEPLENGGLRRWFKIASKEENKKAPITITLITIVLTTVLVTPISTTISKVIEKRFEDTELKDLEKQKLKLEIEKLKQETSYNIHTLDRNNVIKKKKSNFYESLDKYKKIDKIGFTLSDNDKKTVEEKIVFRKSFKEFILITDELEPEEYDNVVIEIISPVLKKGKYKWMGIYKGEPVSFSMKSKEFKEFIQQGQIQFKNGTSINCSLTIKKKIDNEGIEKITNIEVNRVNYYFENDKPIETPEGRIYRKKKEAEKQQLNLFAINNEVDE